MVCSPASQITMWNPTACQIDMNMIAGMAVEVLFSQSVPWTVLNVTVCSMLLTSPSRRYMKRHRIETTTIEVTTGTKYRVRKKFVARALSVHQEREQQCEARTAAARRPPRSRRCCAATSRTAGRRRAGWKLSSPVISVGSREMSRALVKASMKHRMQRDEEEHEQQDDWLGQ